MKKTIIALAGAAMLTSGVAYASGGKVHWGYHGEEGPAHWGSLSHDYAICGSGKNQSPIDLVPMYDANLEAISFNYKATGLDVVNNGHSIQANYAAGSSMTIEGTTYKLLQFHFHTPSENTINGKSYPMEAHLVHADADGNLAVVAIMFTEGHANSVVDAVWGHMPAHAGETAKADTTVNVMDMMPASMDYYRFNGSLTTPPCSEGVKWFVLKTPVEASKAQFDKFTATMGGPNNRPVQPVNARTVLE